MEGTDKRGTSPSGKRKHEADNSADSDSDSDAGPQLPSAQHDAPAKRPRTIGPAMPPPDMIPQANDSDSDSDDDDDYGPSLPPPPGASTAPEATNTTNGPEPTVSAPTKRDDWMLRPPDEVDLGSRMDPTKLRSRKFNTAPSRPAGGASSGPSKMWTETPDEKRKRLENEIMGIQAPAGMENAPGKQMMSEAAVAKARQVQEYNDKLRNKSLYSKHKDKKEDVEKDDPSARPFDKEKDIRAPSKITNAQRREMVNKSSNFSSRFAGGNFL